MGKQIDIVHVAMKQYRAVGEWKWHILSIWAYSFKTGVLYILTFSQWKTSTTNDDPLTEEQQDNKHKFSDMIANLFK